MILVHVAVERNTRSVVVRIFDCSCLAPNENIVSQG